MALRVCLVFQLVGALVHGFHDLPPGPDKQLISHRVHGLRLETQSKLEHQTPQTAKTDHAALKLHRDLSMLKGIAVHPLPMEISATSSEPEGIRSFAFVLLCSFFVVIGLIVGTGGIVLVMQRYAHTPVPSGEEAQFEIFSAKATDDDRKHPGCTRIIRSSVRSTAGGLASAVSSAFE